MRTGSVGVVPTFGPSDAGADARADDSGAPEDAPAVEATLRIERPMDGVTLPRAASDGVDFFAAIEARVVGTGLERIELGLDGMAVGMSTGSTGVFALELRTDGLHTLSAVGFDASGIERARDSVEITVTPPDDGSCHGMLDALGIDWEPRGPTQGIADPVRVEPFINDVSYRYVSNEAPTALTMDCELAARLFRLSELVKPYGIDEVIHIGVYNYRCIGGGTPGVDDCTPSQHAYARAIDIWGFGLAGSDTEYVLERDWIITPGSTCPGTATGEADRVLHELACAMGADRIFQIILTPNYNAAHRNHFHVDMTSGSMTVRSTVQGVDPEIVGLDDACLPMPPAWQRAFQNRPFQH